MNVLLIASRFPWPVYSGDRLRTTIWLDALSTPFAEFDHGAREGRGVRCEAPRRGDAGTSRRSGNEADGVAPPRDACSNSANEVLKHANVALVAPPGDAPRGVRFYPARRSLANGARAIAHALRGDLPWQSLLAAPYAWHDAIARARSDFGSFDATVVILTRLHPWIPAAEGTRILDAIDSLARSMHERARAASPWTRWIWRAEKRRTARADQEIERAYDHILYVSAGETGARGIAISNGVQVRPLEARTRKYDFGFWGRLAYFANADAARWLIEEIWPAIRAIKPDATLVIAGADAPPDLRRAADRAGITFLSPAGDIAALARDVRVAILPLRYGTGESTKMLEAAEAGCGVVATPYGVRGLPELAKHATIAEDGPGLARAAVRALTEEHTELRRVVVQHYSREKTLEQLRELVRRTAA